ncbi:MAG TPA: TIGR01777 family oxidoreductase, partial [Candidatus Binatus sp.]|nr:TIGR01777 family oxidoreductase [Candidatus Binatus sp.]
DSRVVGTRNLVSAIASSESRPKVLVSASAVGYYGDRGDEELDERSSKGDGFLADVCEEWEREAMAAEKLGVRVACIRVGVGLAAHGGALAAMLTPFRMGVGGRLGSGRQWMPWIHLKDLVGVMLHASRNDSIRGPMNGVAPHPVTNLDFTRALANAVHRPALLPVPRIALRLALGEVSDIMLGSQRVFPKVAEQSGYVFEHPDLAGALENVMASQSSSG